MTTPTPGPAEQSHGTGGSRKSTPGGQSTPGTGRFSRRSKGKAAASDAGRQPAARTWKSSDDWGVFRTVVIAVGVLIAGIGIYYLVTGTAGVAETSGGAVNASLESQFRFFSAMMVGVGAAFVAIAIKFQWANMLWLVCLMVFLGGIGRVLSWAFSGTPHFTLIILMILELAFPPALLVWHRFIAKTSALKSEIHRGRAGGEGSAPAGA
ncbi:MULTISPECIES: DUF4345 domain-containing protein [Arthrobacter]|uniref:DUF4345 domain-containing protein n=1 Tax=Arthrobacter caoxuetaonis TaxID=2886935 RepID=A0A9X1ME23_9MICC|nr:MULTISPECIES: DUF4345 domain-containing protein [Arthrobacter]MCC3283942.1 DUF4345 domain-containing protein [Arthrobacter caoxuetaonis]MCC3297064.1 DUF4345 domain-containing protein [Arthrobacter caoxuetaonis]MCC9193951.1 DUF4345 domain-containing protein [Arthrobacter sp. zg-Y916]USQ58369.1 DUF4345 domain-containing protein [Arthrobacter caoxuetaonis]